MKDIIKDLYTKKIYHQEEARKIIEAIDALRKVCSHEDVVDDGRDSHHYYTKCAICGERFKD